MKDSSALAKAGRLGGKGPAGNKTEFLVFEAGGWEGKVCYMLKVCSVEMLFITSAIKN